MSRVTVGFVSLYPATRVVLGKGTADSPALLSFQAARQKTRDAAQFPFLWTIGLPLSERRMEVHGQINVTLPTAASACRPARLSGESERVAVFSSLVFNGSAAHSLIPSQLHREGRKVNEFYREFSLNKSKYLSSLLLPPPPLPDTKYIFLNPSNIPLPLFVFLW